MAFVKAKHEQNTLAARNWREFLQYGTYIAIAWKYLLGIYATWFLASVVILAAAMLVENIIWSILASIWAVASFCLIAFTFLGAPFFIFLIMGTVIWTTVYAGAQIYHLSIYNLLWDAPFMPTDDRIDDMLYKHRHAHVEQRLYNGQAIVGEDGELLIVDDTPQATGVDYISRAHKISTD